MPITESAFPMLMLAGAVLAGLLLGIWLQFWRNRAANIAQHASAQQQLALLEQRLQISEQHRLDGEQQLSSKKRELQQLREDWQALREQYLHGQAQAEQQHKLLQEKLKLLQQARSDMQHEYQNLAHQLIEDSRSKLGQHHKQAMDTTVTPLKEQLLEFKRKIEEVYDKETRDRVSLQQEISHLKQLNQRISEEANSLASALKGDNKVQGNWGEMVLQRVLENSGLRAGHEYQLQVSIADQQGQRRQPDVVLQLPEGRQLIIDAKMSLVSYEQYCNAADDSQRAQALKAFQQSLKQHIKGLAAKSYEQLPGLQTLDLVFLFIPVEAAFVLAVQESTDLFTEAYQQHIILVSPSTLLAMLKTVESLWRHERQNRNAEEIARQAGGLHDQFALVLESLSELGKQIDRSKQAYEQTYRRVAEGKGNLLKRSQDLQKLGAKTKRQLPELIDGDE